MPITPLNMNIPGSNSVFQKSNNAAKPHQGMKIEKYSSNKISSQILSNYAITNISFKGKKIDKMKNQWNNKIGDIHTAALLSGIIMTIGSTIAAPIYTYNKLTDNFDTNYTESVEDLAGLSYSADEMPKDISHIVQNFKDLQNKIASDIPPEQKQAFDAKYQKQLDKIEKLAEEYKDAKNSQRASAILFSIISAAAAFVTGILITSKIDEFIEDGGLYIGPADGRIIFTDDNTKHEMY